MFNRISIFSALFFLAAAGAGAYEKIEFKSQILNPGFMKLSAVTAAGGRTYVADAKANCVFIFDAEGKAQQKAEGGLKGPQAVSFGDGRLYVADTGNSRIAVFDAEGKPLWAFAGVGQAPGQLSGPRGVSYGPDSRVYVSNTGNSRVDVFNSDGIYLYGFPVLKADGVTKLNPAKIAVSYDGDVYVSDPAKALLQKYDRVGKLIREYPLANDGAMPDLNGFVYTISSKEGKVRELAGGSGEVIGTFGTRGKGKSEFKKLADIAIDEAGNLLLCDEENKKVVTIRVEGTEGGARLGRAAALDRFTVKGPAAKYPFKADAFAVTPENAIVAYMPETKEVVLAEGENRKPLIKSGPLQGQVKNPRGLFVDAKGMIYVADSGNDRVQIFNPDGTYSNMFGESGSDEGQFRNPVSVTVNSKGNIYVADNKNKKIKAFSPDGMFLFAVGPQLGNLTLMSPVAVRCDENKNVYVLDSVLKKVIVTDAMGKFLRVWDDSGNLQDPAAMSYDQKGFFYILDKGSFNVKIFDVSGKFTASFFAKGRGERELWTPQNLAFRNDRIFISDMENSRIVSFDISYLPEAPAELKAEAGKTGVDLAWTANKNAWTGGFKVYRSAGADGEIKEAGAAKEMKFSDDALESGTTYFYYVAGVSVTGVRGALSAAAEVYFKGPEAAAAKAAAKPAENKNLAPVEILAGGSLNYIFSSNYKYYMKNPIGKITIRNNTDSAFSNLKVSVDMKDFMDYPTDTPVAEIKAKEKVDVDLMATLNNKILTINEDTPIQCRLTLTYYQDGAEKTVSLNQPIKVLSKNAIVWDDSSRLANFITVNDTPVKALKSAMMTGKEEYLKKADFMNDTLVQALMIWEGLGELGINYQPDPVSPFSAKKSTGMAEMPLDTVQFPRQTIKLKSGDCDDLTALYASLFTAAGLPTAILDFPGHIALMVDTREKDAKNVGIPEEYLIKYNDTWWVGVEGTMTGKNFYDGVKHEADLYKNMAAEVKVIDIGAAQKQFEPVTLPETEYEGKLDMGVYGKRVADAIDAMRTTRYEYFKKYYGQILLNIPDDVDANLNLGILEGQYDKDAAAGEYFGKVLQKEPGNAAALNNMGNLAFKAAKYDEARDYFLKAAKADPFDADIWLNLARVADKQGKKDDVQTFTEKAARIDPGAKSTGDKLLN
ncbi:MAG TPA: hypothetical protein PKI19_06005 [Elusimicrobiales bacterium]|nr:hypothetical protein [Elusimicrobiales bacterium]